MMGQINAGILFNSLDILKKCTEVYGNNTIDRPWYKDFCKVVADFEKLGYPIHGMFCWRSIVLFRPDMGIAVKIANNGVSIISQAVVTQTKYGTYLWANAYALNVEDYTKILPHAHRPFKFISAGNLKGVRRMINALVKGDYALADAIEITSNL